MSDALTRILLLSLLPSLLLLLPNTASPHPLAPALLELDQRPDGTLDVLWKTSSKPEPGVLLIPRLPERCEVLGPARESSEGVARVLRFRLDCGAAPLRGESIAIEGIERSRAGVLVRVRLAGAAPHHQMLGADTPRYTFDAANQDRATFTGFLGLGFEHLVRGWDHLLFVVAIALVLGWGSRLVWTLTAFTLGHSSTLALTALGYVRFPTPLVEALISLSILFAASQLARGRDRDTAFQRAPWLLATVFGLLHGMGFAGALSRIGLPSDEIPSALLGFNVGIELAQLVVVGVTLGLARILSTLAPHPLARLRPLAGYSLGLAASIGFWQQITSMPLR